MAAIPANEVSMTTPAMKLTGSTSSQDIIDLLKAHEYFRSVSEAALDEIARFGAVTHYDAAAIVHELNDPLAHSLHTPWPTKSCARGLARR
jgi:hypothetical protein